MLLRLFIHKIFFLKFFIYAHQTPNCDKTNAYFGNIGVSQYSKGLSFNDNIEICDRKSGFNECCNKSQESILYQIAVNKYKDSLIKDFLSPLRMSLIDFSYSFDPIIIEIINKSEIDMELMFNKTYLKGYPTQSHLFVNFFDGLKQYYNQYPIDINSIIKKLFIDITKMVYFLRNNRDIEGECINANFDQIEPFGPSLPEKIRSQLVKSIDSVKLYTLSLTRSRDLIISLYTLFQNPTFFCTKNIAQMRTCHICASNNQFKNIYNFNDIKPCYSYCIHMYESCMGVNLEQIDEIWYQHIKTMKKLSWIIDNDLNFENTLNLLYVKIADIIAHLQANWDFVQKKIVKFCRNTSEVEYSPKHSISMFYHNKRIKLRRSHEYSTKISKLGEFFARINEFYKDFSGFWKTLVPNVCKNINPNNNDCWDGSSYRKNMEQYQTDQSKNFNNSQLWRQIEFFHQFNELINKKINIEFTSNYITGDDKSKGNELTIKYTDKPKYIESDLTNEMKVIKNSTATIDLFQEANFSPKSIDLDYDSNYNYYDYNNDDEDDDDDDAYEDYEDEFDNSNDDFYEYNNLQNNKLNENLAPWFYGETTQRNVFIKYGLKNHANKKIQIKYLYFLYYFYFKLFETFFYL